MPYLILSLLSFQRNSYFKMGVSIETWRARIGSFHGRSHMIVFTPITQTLQSQLLGVLHFLVILMLLVIGNIELNPGPGNTFSCPYCNFKANTTGEHITHQKKHESLFNFRYVCPLQTCSFTFTSFASANAHVSHHSIPRNQVIGHILRIQCANCDKRLPNNKELCDHLRKAHLKLSQEVVCPLPDCSRTKPFSTAPNFSNHLSLYHPGWKSDFSTSVAADHPVREHSSPRPEDNLMDSEETGMDTGEANLNEFMDVDSSDTSDSSHSNVVNVTADGLVMSFAQLYVYLEGDRLVPSTTVDLLAQRLSSISEAMQEQFRSELTKQLTSVVPSEDDISNIATAVLANDPLYNIHHKTAAGVYLGTKHVRRTFYKKHFKLIEATEVNLHKNPYDREALVYYIDIKETLKVLLEDPTVQKEIEESFERRRLPAGTVISDYTSGSVFLNGDNPVKAIDVFLFMDAFGCANPLGSAKNEKKYKICGAYLTLGNFKPHLRAYLDSMRLVMLFQNSLLQTPALYKRCFKRLIRDLKYLEQNGIDFQGEKIAFRLQFVQGDNLGQHTIGGFMESFTGHYFCRFCDISKAMFHEDRSQRKPVFRNGEWRTHESFCQDLDLKNQTGHKYYRGVYRQSPLNQLTHFKVCDPRLAPCIAHDLFLDGVVDCDLAAMLKYFQENGVFEYKKLNRKIKKFVFHGVDSRNKPGRVNESGLKLGGHAVQNWTLLRVLPFLIGDLVNTRNKVWKLYLLLKTICEYICAPSLSPEQIEHLRRLQKKYMSKRSILPNNCKPKHHFFLHIPDLFYKFGALIYHWTMGFEHKHQFFKRAARVCKNFINLGFTLASKHQLLQAYLNTGNLFLQNPVASGDQPLLPENYEASLQAFIRECNFSGSAMCVKYLTFSRIKYKAGQWLLLEKAPDNNDLYLGKVELLVCDGNECKAVLSKHRAIVWPEYGLYKISTEAAGRCVVSFEDLLTPTPQPVYKFLDELCFSLKHVLLNMI